MGRYYSGDIEGKFWVAVQESCDAEFFGGDSDLILEEGEDEPREVNFLFTREDLPDIQSGVAQCLQQLGKHKAGLDEFFRLHSSYTDEELATQLGCDLDQVRELLVWYARLGLGEKILQCVQQQGECSFDAEL